jgi:hypothetical protein
MVSLPSVSSPGKRSLVAACCFLALSAGSAPMTSAGDSPKDGGDPDPYRSCAVNCLYVICRIRGVDVAFSSTADLLQPRKNGDCSIADIERAATAIGLEPVSARLDRRDLPKVPFPAIVHLRSRAPRSASNHYVVLMGLFRRGVVTIDPPNAATCHPYQEFYHDWTGVVVAFPRDPHQRSAFIASLASGSAWMPWSATALVVSVLLVLAWNLKMILNARGRARRSAVVQSISGSNGSADREGPWMGERP